MALGTLTSLLAALSGAILTWVLSPSFTNLSYTNPAGNELIKIGLGITQNFVNVILILGLVYIALVTILRLGGYSTQKLLITFIAVALLVNFAPVIVGLIVDASNIVMNVFIERLTGLDVFVKNMSVYWNDIKKMFGDSGVISDTKQQFAIMAQTFVMIIFNFFLAVVLFLFSVLFLARYIAIWILTILSPLAFVCLIFPKGKPREIWNKWWHELINWSIIGVAAAFFLYLGINLVRITPTAIGTHQTAEWSAGLFGGVLPYIASLAFLYIGLIIAQQSSAMGASQITTLATKGRKKFQGWAASGRGRLMQLLPGGKKLQAWTMNDL